MSEAQVIPFDEILPEASVRFTVIDEVQYLSIRDIIMVMCDQNNDRAGKTWRNIPENFKNEVRSFLTNFKFKGRGQQEQPVIQFQGALKLMMWLPGEQAKKFRSKAAEILTRYYAGDKTLMNEVWANAQSKQAINEAARGGLNVGGEEEDEEDRDGKRKKMELSETGEWAREAVMMIQCANTHLRKHIGLKRQLYNVELDGERKKLEAKEAMFELEEKIHAQKMKIHAQQMKHGDDEIDLMKRTELAKMEVLREAKIAQEECGNGKGGKTVASEQNTHTTVVRVFESSRGQFKGLLKKAESELLGRAGFRAKCDYKAVAGLEPLYNPEGVCVYPISATGLILEALRTIYRSMMAGDTQTSINEFLVVAPN